MAEINYKSKYTELKQKFMNAVDTAFRLGFEQGAQQAQVEQMAQQQADAQAAEQAAMAGQQGAEGQDPNGDPNAQDPNAQPQEQSQNPAGSELDQHIAQLEGMLGKSEISADDLKKAVQSVKDLKKTIEFNAEIKKSTEAIPKIAAALHRPAFKIGQQANANMTDSAKVAVSMQAKLLEEVFSTWATADKKAENSIANLIHIEGLTTKE